MNRSLRWTHRSIHHCLLKPLREAGFDIVCAAHFHTLNAIQNTRSGENSVKARRDEERYLPLDALWRETQTRDILPASLAELYEPLSLDEPAETLQSRRNLLFQLRSLNQLNTMLISMGADSSDVFFFMRPDLMYLDPLDTRLIVDRLTSAGKDILTPDWHEWGGFNDRFAFCNFRGADVFATRMVHAIEFVQATGGLKAETFLHHVVERHGLAHGHIGMRAMRVRADGFTQREGFDLSPYQKWRVSLGNRLRRPLR